MNDQKENECVTVAEPTVGLSSTSPRAEERSGLSAPIPDAEVVRSKSYTLRGEHGEWLGQVVLTSDGMFASVTDWGNLSYAWRSYGEGDFRKFICTLNVGYFGGKLFTGMAYILSGRKCEDACMRFAIKILPALQAELRKELDAEALSA